MLPAGVVRDWRILWLSGCWLLVAAVMFGMVGGQAAAADAAAAAAAAAGSCSQPSPAHENTCLAATLPRLLPRCLQTFFMPLLVSAMFSGGGAISGVSGGGGGGHGACHSDDGDGESGGEGERQHSSLVALASAVPFMLAVSCDGTFQCRACKDACCYCPMVQGRLSEPAKPAAHPTHLACTWLLHASGRGHEHQCAAGGAGQRAAPPCRRAHPAGWHPAGAGAAGGSHRGPRPRLCAAVYDRRPVLVLPRSVGQLCRAAGPAPAFSWCCSHLCLHLPHQSHPLLPLLPRPQAPSSPGPRCSCPTSRRLRALPSSTRLAPWAASSAPTCWAC